MAKVAFLFPGQGAQQVGMGKDLYDSCSAAREVFDRAEAACGLKLRQLCFQGPEEQLARTDISQPAIFTTSAAALAALGAAGKLPQPTMLAGLSLGEYTALYAAGAMDLESAVRLVARRGELMQAAATAVPSGMVSIIGLDAAKAQELCAAAADGGVLTCANFNCPGQIVISGQLDACGRAAELAPQFGASAVPLKVAGAFHSPIMQPAAEQLAAAIDAVRFNPPSAPVIANVDAKPYTDVSQIRPKLLAQLTGAVRWQQCVEAMLAAGVEQFYEIGPGRVLAGLMRRINRRAAVVNVNSAKAVQDIAAGA